MSHYSLLISDIIHHARHRNSTLAMKLQPVVARSPQASTVVVKPRILGIASSHVNCANSCSHWLLPSLGSTTPTSCPCLVRLRIFMYLACDPTQSQRPLRDSGAKLPRLAAAFWSWFMITLEIAWLVEVRADVHIPVWASGHKL